MSKGLPKSMQRANPQLADIIKVAVPIRDLSITVSATGAAIGFGSAVLGGLPQGNILLLGAVAYVQLTTTDTDISAPWHGDFGIGFAPTADADLGDALEDAIVPSTTIDADGSTKASLIVRGVSTQTEQSTIIDNTAGDLELNLNVLIDAADIANDTSAVFVANGILHLAYTMLGDD